MKKWIGILTGLFLTLILFVGANETHAAGKTERQCEILINQINKQNKEVERRESALEQSFKIFKNSSYQSENISKKQKLYDDAIQKLNKLEDEHFNDCIYAEVNTGIGADTKDFVDSLIDNAVKVVEDTLIGKLFGNHEITKVITENATELTNEAPGIMEDTFQTIGGTVNNEDFEY